MQWNKNKVVTFLLYGFILVLLLAAAPAHSQENREWGFAATMYLWGAGLDGEIAARGRSVAVDQSFGDILENLELAFMGGVRAYKRNWAVTGDFMYVGLGATVEPPIGPSVEVDVDQIIIGGDVGYQVAQNVEILAGMRVVSLQNKLTFQGPIGLQVEADKTWVDPVFGIRFAPVLSESWSLWTRFDIGGFDVGSHLTWQINANAIWHFSDRASLAMGYRVLDMDYDDEEGDNTFVYDVTSHGPIAGVVLEF